MRVAPVCPAQTMPQAAASLRPAQPYLLTAPIALRRLPARPARLQRTAVRGVASAQEDTKRHSSQSPTRQTTAVAHRRSNTGSSSSSGGSRQLKGSSSGGSPPPKGDDEDDGGTGTKASIASVGALLGLIAVAGGAYLCRDQINDFVYFFIDIVEAYGPLGYVAYAVVYTLLELLAVPAIPLTMTAGAIFGVVPGTALVSVSATAAATMAFLVARYAARERVQQIAERNPRWQAVDRAIGRDSFRVVLLLRLSPLMPLAVGNYLYGLTSVELLPYVLGSWLGMLPGTLAYVAAGSYGRELLAAGGDGGAGGPLAGVPMWQVALGVSATLGAVGYIGYIAKKALAEVAEEDL